MLGQRFLTIQCHASVDKSLLMAARAQAGSQVMLPLQGGAVPERNSRNKRQRHRDKRLLTADHVAPPTDRSRRTSA
jgi:hypothetical protein